MQSIASIKDSHALPWLVAGLGALFAGWLIFRSHGVINNDGVLYIEVARLFSEGEWAQGFELYNWPFYSLLLALFHHVFGLNFQIAAHLLAIFFLAMSCIGIMRVVQEAGGNRHAMMAAGLLLLCSPYLIGDILPMVVRDQGFWAFHLWSVLFLMRFNRTSELRHALGWGVLAAITTLFRIEGVSFFVLLPLALLLKGNSPKRLQIVMFLRANTVLLISLVSIAITLTLSPHLKLEDLGRLVDPLRVGANVYLQLTQGLYERADLIADKVLGRFLDDYAFSGLLVLLTWILAIKLITSAGWLQLLLFISGVKNHNYYPQAESRRILVLVAFIGICNTAFILLSNFILPKRMAAPVAFIIIIFAAFAFAVLFEQARKASNKSALTWFAVACMAMIVQFVSILWPSSTDTRYELDAARWMIQKKNSTDKVFYDSKRLRYYAGESYIHEKTDWTEIQELLNTAQASEYVYLVLHADKNRPEQQQLFMDRLGNPIKTFDDGHRNTILIYRVPETLSDYRK